jgi:DNA repair protein RecN (Recombination protein N)
LIDLFEFQIEEIDSAALTPGEEEVVREERDQQLHFEKVSTTIEKAHQILYGGQSQGRAVVDLLGKTTAELKEIVRYHRDVQSTAELVEQAMFLIQDASRELAGMRETLTHEPYRLEELEARLDAINRLKKKYGDSIEQVLTYRHEAAASLERIHGSHERVKELLSEQKILRQKYNELARELSDKRRTAGSELALQAQSYLQELGLKGARLEISIRERNEAIMSVNGNEDIELLFSANMGEDLRPLHKVASGGEISRVMLALKVVLTGIDRIPTLIFDEIDSGVGGRTAYRVAQRIAEVARGRQVLCITHLPQIAAAAQTHLYVTKTEDGGRTFTSVLRLDQESRIAELARMMSGENHETALNHAREMLLRQAAL